MSFYHVVMTVIFSWMQCGCKQCAYIVKRNLDTVGNFDSNNSRM